MTAGDSRFQATLDGLGTASGGFLYSEGKFDIGYFKGNSWDAQRTELLSKIGRLVVDANLSVDPSSTMVGDNDFAANGEFGLFMIHGFLVMCVAAAFVIRALVRGDGRSAPSPGSKD